MYARFFHAQVSAEKVDEFIRLWHDEMLPGAANYGHSAQSASCAARRGSL